MFFFMEKEQLWRRYMEELGLNRVIDNLESRGKPSFWVTQVADPAEPGTLKATVTASSYRSKCPHYDGYWLCGGTGAVECAAAGERLPGIVWYEVCSKEYEKCPFCGKKGEG